MKFLGALLSLAALASCAGPISQPADDAAVVQPGVICRVSHSGGPMVAERGIGGTGGPTRTQVSDRGIGGTGIVGVVTGFASICVDGLEVRFDKTVPVSINGSAATSAQLRAGQLVVIIASGTVTPSDPVVRAGVISVRYEVSGPIEAVDTGSGAMMVAGQRVMVIPTTWVDGRFGRGNWVTVSGLRRPDGTIVASRLDRLRVGGLAVRGQLDREHETTRIGSLILHGPAVATARAGEFVSVAGSYVDGVAQVTSIDTDLAPEDPTGYLGGSVDQLIVQAFVHVENGMVWLNNDRKFKAGPEVQRKGSGYRNAIVWLKRTVDGYTATELHYTNYRAQPRDAPPRAQGRAGSDLVLPPDAPPGSPTDAPDGESGGGGATDREPQADTPLPGDGASDVVPAPAPSNVPTSNIAPSRVEPQEDPIPPIPVVPRLIAVR